MTYSNFNGQTVHNITVAYSNIRQTFSKYNLSREHVCLVHYHILMLVFLVVLGRDKSFFSGAQS